MYRPGLERMCAFDVNEGQYGPCSAVIDVNEIGLLHGAVVAGQPASEILLDPAKETVFFANLVAA